MWATRRGAVGGKQIGFGDEGIVAFVVDPRMDEAAVHPPGTVPCRTPAAGVKQHSKTGNPQRDPGRDEEVKQQKKGRFKFLMYSRPTNVFMIERCQHVGNVELI